MTTLALTDLQQDFRGTLILPADARYEVAPRRQPDLTEE